MHPSTPAPPTSSIQGLESDMVISLCRALYRGILLLRHVPYRLRRVAPLLHYPTRHMCPSEGDIQGFQARGVGDDLSPTHGQRRWRLRTAQKMPICESLCALPNLVSDRHIAHPIFPWIRFSLYRCLQKPWSTIPRPLTNLRLLARASRSLKVSPATRPLPVRTNRQSL